MSAELAGNSLPAQSDREEIERLRRELRETQAENALLKEAAALLAKDMK